jgi:predicted transcriptional regulator
MKFNWDDYSFVVRGKQRRKILSLMDGCKTPTELKKESGLNFNNVSRVLVQFTKHKLARCLTPKQKVGRVYTLTLRGKEVREELLRKYKDDC